MTTFLLLLVIGTVVGVWWIRRRGGFPGLDGGGSIESGISSFEREMRALAPPDRRPRGPRTSPHQPPDDPGARPEPGAQPGAWPELDDPGRDGG